MPNLYLTKDGEIVEEGDTRAAFQAYREGTALDAARLDSFRPGLSKEVQARIDKGKKPAAKVEEEPEPESEEKAVEEPVEDKAVEGPPANKSRRSRG